ncbi:MAG: hypothetical protein ACPG4T_13670 [Nannocystaceae bacterium]
MKTNILMRGLTAALVACVLPMTACVIVNDGGSDTEATSEGTGPNTTDVASETETETGTETEGTETEGTETEGTETETTEEPTTDGPTTDDPTTDGPTTEDPTTEDPTTEDPTTEDPTTEDPTTEDPTTEDPTTEDPTTEDPTTEDPGDGFADKIYPDIISPRCGCHVGGSGGLSMPDMMGAYNNLVDAPSGDVPGMNRVEPGDPDNSYMFHKISNTQGDVGGAGGRMPLGGELSAADISMIEDWILDGAPL